MLILGQYCFDIVSYSHSVLYWYGVLILTQHRFAHRRYIVSIRDGNSAAYAAARCCWCTAPRSVATKICITSQHQRSAAYKNFFTFFLQLLLVIFSLWTIIVSLDVTIIRYELKTMHATTTRKGAFSSNLFFQNSEHPRIGYFGYKKLSFDRLNVFFFWHQQKDFGFGRLD